MDNKNIYVEDRVKMPRKYLNEGIFFLLLGTTPWVAWFLGFRPNWLLFFGTIFSIFMLGLVLFQHIVGYRIRRNTTLKMKINTETKDLHVWMHKAPEAWKKEFNAFSNRLDLNNLTGASFKRINGKPAVMFIDNNNSRTMYVPFRILKDQRVKDFLSDVVRTNTVMDKTTQEKVLTFINTSDEKEAYELTKSKYELEEEGKA